MATTGVAGKVYASSLIDIKTGKSVKIEDIVAGGSDSYVLPAATESALGGVKKAQTQADSMASDVSTLVSDFNALLAKLKAAGIMS
ncbi:head fiber protein [Escherichia coli]|uniref:head fiber protein n=1 Tax=Escherichia coli TaxID=562 RepID=UPI000CFDA4F2|nr:head fiber protein [Escherichia coli]UDW09820.1 hypothetical protein [Escherichia phage 18-1-2]UJQ87226.1 hypothetical protein [Escherichia phage 24-2-1]UJQ87487.1 hypothetical protein [Escherichia phage 19-1-2]UOX40085.1 hypothetical protein [Escherichia phage vB_EcoM_TH18]